MTPDDPQANPSPAFDIGELATQAITVPMTPGALSDAKAQTVPAIDSAAPYSKSIAARPVDVGDVVELIESSGGAANLRFEPGQYAKKLTHNYRTITAIINANKCSHETAHVIYSCSWGAFQIMGFNLYDPDDCACRVSVFDYVADMDKQRAAFFVYLHRAGIAFTLADLRNDYAKRLHFATVYNGPGDVENYAAKISRAITALGVA